MHTNFSATIGCYKNDNPEDFKTAFLSIYNQTVKPSEIIITVDGPIPPELNEYVQEFEDKYGAIVIRSEVNEGQGIAHAKAVLRCKYPLIALMDADDISVPDRFEKQLKIFENDPDIDIVGGYIKEFIDDCTNVVGVRIVPETDSQIKKYLKTRCPMNQVTIMFKKDSVLKSGNYQHWHYDEDYFLYCRMVLNNCCFYNIQENLVNVRVGKEMYKRRGGWKYFKSESKLQGWMLSHKIISLPQYIINVFIRFCVQVVMPNSIRSFIFKSLFRGR